MTLRQLGPAILDYNFSRFVVGLKRVGLKMLYIGLVGFCFYHLSVWGLASWKLILFYQKGEVLPSHGVLLHRSDYKPGLYEGNKFYSRVELDNPNDSFGPFWID